MTNKVIEKCHKQTWRQICFDCNFHLILTEVIDMNNMDEVLQAISIGLIVAYFLLNTNRVLKSIEICNECLVILKHKAGIKDDKVVMLFHKKLYLIMSKAYHAINDNTNAMKYAEKIIEIYRESGEKLAEYELSFDLAKMYFRQSKYAEARKLYENALLISTETSNKQGEASCYGNIGVVYQSVGEYDKAREHYEKSLVIRKEIGDRNGKATCYANLGVVYQSVGEYDKASEHYEKSLVIKKEIGDRNGEATCYANLGAVYQSVGEYDKAREHCEKSLVIRKEIGDRNGEATCYGSLGVVYQSVGEHDKAREHLEKSLVITKDIGDRNGEATCYANLGKVYQLVGEYDKAREHYEKSLVIKKEIGDRNGEATCYGYFGNVYQSVGEYDKAREHLEKSLVIKKDIGDRNGEAACYENLGIVYESVGEYDKAREHLEKSLVITKEIGSRIGEASSLSGLGSLYLSVGEEDKANEQLEKALAIRRETGDKEGVISCCNTLAASFLSLGKYSTANKYNQDALIMASQIGDRAGKATCLLIQGDIVHSIGDRVKAKEYCEQAIAISKEIGHQAIEASCCLLSGKVLLKDGEHVKAQEYFMKSLQISEDIGNISSLFQSLCGLARLRVQEGRNQEATSYLLASIEQCEKIRGSLQDNDQWKISFSDSKISPYRDLCTLFFKTENPEPALYVLELGKARALADLMSAKYSVKNQVSANPETWSGIESIVVRERNCCLYLSYSSNSMYFWILKRSGVMHFRAIEGKDLIAYEQPVKNLDDFFATKSFRSFGISPWPTEQRKDESVSVIQGKSNSWKDDSHEGFRIGNESKKNQGPKMNLPQCHKLIIAPVADLLDGSEIIIVPDRSLYNIPFAALPDENGKTLSETFKIRVAPSLTTLRLIHDSPADYHSQTGALIVGNPDVGEVIFKGCRTSISRLPYAEEEAKMVGRKLGVEPLLGQQATKQTVLQAMDSVALIHLAAHGDAERGAIALAPPFYNPNYIPGEGLYLLTMSDISKVQLRAKLVVLSCCHSARGEIKKAEGAVGIARAFLGSGARSVLVSLWALDDSSTEQLMSQFYDHLVRGESASDSLHLAMKWMRCNGYSDVKQWAPFILIGDNVSFDFGK